MLIDAGPLVSLCDRGLPTHAQCRAILASATLPLVTTWACFVEAMHLVGRIGGYPLQQHLWNLIHRDIVDFYEENRDERKKMDALMGRYQNVPMDLADASLVCAADALKNRTVFTLDGDFRIYRLEDGNNFEIRPSP